MRNSFCALLIFLITIPIQAQDCPDHDLSFSSQIQIDAFKLNYPNCTQFMHNLSIGGLEIHDFSAFDNLDYIAGSLNVQDCDTLKTMSAFNELDSVGGQARISSMDSMILLDVFNSLEKVYGGLYINHQIVLDSITPFPELELIMGTYSISFNRKLRALPEVNTVSGISHLSFAQNWLLDKVNGTYELLQGNPNVSLSNFILKSYENMEIVADQIKRLSISNHDELLDVKGFINATTITGELWFYKNKKLKNFEGIESITFVQNQIDIWDNDGLINCKGMDNLTGPLSVLFKVS